jgi:hypothetical protein
MAPSRIRSDIVNAIDCSNVSKRCSKVVGCRFHCVGAVIRKAKRQFRLPHRQAPDGDRPLLAQSGHGGLANSAQLDDGLITHAFLLSLMHA